MRECESECERVSESESESESESFKHIFNHQKKNISHFWLLLVFFCMVLNNLSRVFFCFTSMFIQI